MIDFTKTHLSADSPPYAVPPYIYRGNEMLTITIRTDPEVLRALVPEPLQPNAEDLLVLYVGWLHVVEPSAITYGEAGIMIPSSLGERVGTFMPVLYLDEVEMLTSGREVWGFPKCRGDIQFQRSQRGVEAGVTVDGTTLIHAQMDFLGPAEPRPVYDREHFLLKSIPAVTGDGYEVRQINTCLVRNDTRKELLQGTPNLSLASTPDDPLGDIPVEEIVASVYTVGDIVLDHGEVIHDYLDRG